MPFIQVDAEQEQKEFEGLLKNPEAKKAYDEFEREYSLRLKLARVIKSSDIKAKQSAVAPR